MLNNDLLSTIWIYCLSVITQLLVENCIIFVSYYIVYAKNVGLLRVGIKKKKKVAGIFYLEVLSCAYQRNRHFIINFCFHFFYGLYMYYCQVSVKARGTGGNCHETPEVILSILYKNVWSLVTITSGTSCTSGFYRYP